MIQRLALATALLVGTLCHAGEDAPPEGEPYRPSFGKVLIIHYSHSGNTRHVASLIQHRTGGDIHEIEPATPYADDTIMQLSKRQREEGVLPELKNPPPDPTPYDLIFVGSPVWWGDIPAPMETLLAHYDFGGKPVAVFYTHRGAPADIFAAYEKAVRNGRIIASQDFYNPLNDDPAALEDILSYWLEDIADRPR